MTVNGKKMQIFESGTSHRAVESSVDLARRASDYDLVLPYAGEYTTIIHEGEVIHYITFTISSRSSSIYVYQQEKCNKLVVIVISFIH